MRLEQESISVEEVTIIAETGWTTVNLQNAMNASDLQTYSFVSLLIGVNNQYQGLDFNEFQTEFDELLAAAIELSEESHVVVVSIPDYGVTPFGASSAEEIGVELDAYNAYMNAQAESLEIPFINITEISRELGSGDNALAPDNLHPSGYQYGLWVEEILPAVKGFLSIESA